MKVLVLVMVAACGTPTSQQCPPALDDSSSGGSVEGTACDSTATCFVESTFSSCASGWYKCVSGKWHFDHGIDAIDGHSCVGSPLSGCTIEGNDCSAEPTGGECGCGSDGTWTCTCRCYNGFGVDCVCPATYRDLSGIGCGGDCTYSDGHACTCVKDPGQMYGMFSCQ